jgi:succinate-acetate transporter protein
MASASPSPAPPAPGHHIADPGPLGLAAFALTTFFLSSVNSGLLPVSVEPVVLGLALFYGGIVQVFAGLWEFAKGNTFGAVAFCSYGAFWMSFWYLVAHTDLSKAGADASKGVGFFLLAWTIFTLYMTVVATKTNGILTAVFIVLSVTFICLTIGKLGPSSSMTTLGGWLGLLTAALAWYASFAGVMNATAKAVVLPVFAKK